MTDRLKQILYAQSYPFRSTFDGEGVNFALFPSMLKRLKLRSEIPVLHSPDYINKPSDFDDYGIIWLNSDSQEIQQQHWQDHHNFVPGYMLSNKEVCEKPHPIILLKLP